MGVLKTICAAWRRLCGVEEVVRLHRTSERRSPACSWNSWVYVDEDGGRYARSHDGTLIALYPDGSTADTYVYGTTWVRIA